MPAKRAYNVNFESFSSKDGHKMGGSTIVVKAERDTNAIAEIKRREMAQDRKQSQ